MSTHKKLLAATLLLFLLPSLFQIAWSQEGSPFITNFSSNDESMNENYSLCLDKNGVLLIANRKGILIYDASDWSIVKTTELPLIVSPDPEGELIFTGLRNGIGYLKKNQFGNYAFTQLAGKEAGIVTQIVFVKNYVYFLSQSVLTRINTQDLTEIRYWKSKSQKPYNNLIVFNSDLLIDISGEGLKKVEGNNLTTFNQSFALNGKIIFSLPYDSRNILIGASDNKCYLFDGKQIRNFVIQDQQYISDGNIVDGKQLDESNIIISTSNAGCLVFNKKDGKTVFTANYMSGLPDDEILAMETDKNKGIWLAHYYGLSRIDAGIPVKNFSNYKGLSGKPQSMGFYNDKLFVGTSNGLYYLDKKKDYIEYTVKREQIPPVSKEPEKVTETKDEESTQEKTEDKSILEKSPKRGILSRLFSKKSKTEEVVQPEATKQVVEEKEKEKTSIWNLLGVKETPKEKSPTFQKVYKLTSIAHIYMKVPGFEQKCKQLINFNNKLLALTISGIFEITENKATQVYANPQITYLFPSANSLFICTDKGIVEAKFQAGKWQTNKFPACQDEPVYSFAKDMFDNFWIGVENKVYKVKLKNDGSIKESKVFGFESDLRERVIVRLSNKKPLFFISSGIYSIFNDSIQPNHALSSFVANSSRYYFSHSDYTWVFNGNNWIKLASSAEPDTISTICLNLFSNVTQISTNKSLDLWVLDDNTTIFKIDVKAISEYKSEFSSFIKKFTGFSGESLELTNVELDSKNNFLKILISAPYYIKLNSNQYQIFVKGLSHDWSNWTTNPEFPLPLSSGNWEIKVRAKNIFGKISEEKSLKFYIKRPFYATWWFIAVCILAGLYLIYLFIQFRERSLIKEKEILEQKVKERTRQIEEQKEEIEAQRDDLAEKNVQITKQNEEIEAQSHKIAEQNREITDSIKYAKRLQTAVMPDNDIISSLLSDYFVFFRPKDIVSGDFYWAKRKDDKVIIAAADCTGHGVPGGFLSMLGISQLNEILAIDKDFKAHEVLNLLRTRVKGTLIKEGHSEDETKDGMDIALCIIESDFSKLQYAGANNPLYIIRNKEVIEFDADKMPIGSYVAAKESFTNNEIDLKKGDVLYLFSDGYRDQLGGPQQKRLKSNAFRQQLLNIHDKPMKKQKELLEEFLDNWKGNNEQVDDIMVFGIKI